MARAFRPICLITVLALVLALGAAVVPIGYTQAAGGTYYVDAVGGSDANGGTDPVTDAWKTITHALATVPGGDPDDPDVINVADGIYDAATNGETFPLTIVNDGITLQATGTGATIDGGSSATILDIDGDGVTVDGFTITNSGSAATYAINACDSYGGFTISNNTFTNVQTAVSFYVSATDAIIDYTINDMLISGNTFTVGSYGIRIEIEMDYDATVTGKTFTIGDIDILSNTFNMGTYHSVSMDDIYVQELNGGTISVGDIDVSGNKMYDGRHGVYFYGYFDNLTDTTVTVGEITINNNTLDDQDQENIQLYYWSIHDLHGTTTATAGDVEVDGNTITNGRYGISVDYLGLGNGLSDDAQLTVGDLEVNNNTFDGSQCGISAGYYWNTYTEGNSSFTIGDVNITGNIIIDTYGIDTYWGIWVDYDFCGDTMYVYDSSTQEYGDVLVSDNMVEDSWDGIFVDYCIEGYGNSAETITFGELDITGNELTNITGGEGWGNGIDVEYYLGVFNDVTLNIGRALIQGNTVTECYGSALYMDMYIYEESSAATVNLGDPEVDENIFEDSREGIYFEGVQDAEVTENIIQGNEGAYCGVYITDAKGYPASGNVFRCNNFEGNEPYGLENDGTGEVDAELNWWGDESGPGGVGPGSGDAVSSNVLYEPWLIAPCGEEEVVAGFTLTPPTGQAPLTVQFYDTSTGATTWFWEFGDGSVSEAQYPTHTYQNEGVYSVRLTIEGVGGDTDDASNEVIVEASAGAPNLVVRNLYISGTQVMPRDKVVITADVFNEGEVWGDGDIDLIINGAYEQTAGVGVAPGTSQPISFTIYKVEAGEYQVVIGDAVGTFYVVEEPQPSRIGGIPMDSGTLIALIVIGVFVIAALVVAIVVFRPS
jgi:PKD repeat protein